MNTIEIKPTASSYNLFGPTSRYNSNAVLKNEKGIAFIETWRPLDIPQKKSDSIFAVPPEFAYRPDLVSYQFYNTPSLWWAICFANIIINPLDREEGLYVGRVLRIPDISSIYILGT